ncbi:MAG: hypothetical protein VB100_14440 [Angelakisella sp.]|nr:hypothetical protein [Angelakisella sp.]
MKLLNTEVSINAKDLSLTHGECGEFKKLLAINNEEINRMFSSKYEKRKIANVNIMIPHEYYPISLSISYDNGDVIDVADGVGMVLTNVELQMLDDAA